MIMESAAAALNGQGGFQVFFHSDNVVLPRRMPSCSTRPRPPWPRQPGPSKPWSLSHVRSETVTVALSPPAVWQLELP